MNKSIKTIPFPEIENAYIVISAGYTKHGNGCEIATTFLYATKDGGSEWEPNKSP